MDMSRLESFLFAKMAQTKLPGLSVALLSEEGLLYARAFGQRDLERGLPATPDTLYGVASITKSFTALAILLLAESGSLNPDDPVDRYLPFAISPFGEKVTLTHLMAHTSGIPALAYSEALIGHANGTGGRWLPIGGPEDVLTFMADAGEWVESRPGERWAYANEGYALLGLVIERVSGMSYNDFIRRHILTPLGMERSYFTKEEVDADPDAAIPYVLSDGKPPRRGRYLYRLIRSEGGLVSSVNQLARYLSMFLRKGEGVAREETIASMLEPRVSLPHYTAPALLGDASAPQPAQQYALGLQVETFLGRRLVSHGGDVLVSTGHIAFLPEDGLGVAVLANGSGYSPALIARVALALALNREPTEIPAVALQTTLSLLEGHYSSYAGSMTATVRMHGDFLKVALSGGSEVILVPEDVSGPEPRFFTLSLGRRLPVRFRHGEDGPELLYERHKMRRSGLLQV